VAARLRAEGFLVQVVGDGPGAVAAVRQNPPDLIVLDVMLPGFDGLEVCRRIQGERPVPVLMLTARDDETDQLPDDLASVSLPEAEAEHRDVGAHVRSGHRLAEDVCAFQMPPLALGVGPLSCSASRDAFLSPSLTQLRVLRSHSSSSW
jgi:CheY-like chemotaxis protein